MSKVRHIVLKGVDVYLFSNHGREIKGHLPRLRQFRYKCGPVTTAAPKRTFPVAVCAGSTESEQQVWRFNNALCIIRWRDGHNFTLIRQV